MPATEAPRKVGSRRLHSITGLLRECRWGWKSLGRGTAIPLALWVLCAPSTIAQNASQETAAIQREIDAVQRLLDVARASPEREFIASRERELALEERLMNLLRTLSLSSAESAGRQATDAWRQVRAVRSRMLGLQRQLHLDREYLAANGVERAEVERRSAKARPDNATPSRQPSSSVAPTPRDGGDSPYARHSFPLSSVRNPSRFGRSMPDFEVCNDSDYETAVAIVRTVGTFGAWKQDAFTTEGFFAVPLNECVEVHFGPMQSASVGYLSVAQKIAGRWITPSYRVPPSAFKSDTRPIFEPADRHICWPTAGDPTGVDTKAGCRQAGRSVRFNVAYGMTGATEDIKLYILENGFRQSGTELRYFR